MLDQSEHALDSKEKESNVYVYSDEEQLKYSEKDQNVGINQQNIDEDKNINSVS